MTKRVAGRIAAFSGVALAAALAATPAHAAAGDKIANSYICVFKNDRVARGDVAAKANAAARSHGGAVGHVYSHTIRGFSANMSEQGMNAMRRSNPSIAFCEQDQEMAIAVVAQGRPEGPTAKAETVPWGITRVGGGGSTASGKAWVLDTGIDLDHPDLNVNVALSASFTREKNADDGNGHGSHVAGTIGAKANNGIGVLGVAPGVQLVAVKVLTRSGSGTNSGVIAGVDYAGKNFAAGDVANMSLGGGFSQALNDAVIAAAAKGLKFALAAGNESTSATTKSPASANGPNIYTISSFAQGDTWSSFSNYGNPPVDFAEPGSSIYSTYKSGGYATLSGTSMASPHAAGLLLFGTPKSGGTVSGDPDGNPDTIGIK
ncbi:S8 family serine peptidase [Tsuneonella sp. SYSU-LHT278]|uniref:S8 family serine peptidase n=1 Tax=Tsuneonella sediminis TaxID=3416089 RepID=UPI003F7A3C02